VLISTFVVIWIIGPKNKRIKETNSIELVDEALAALIVKSIQDIKGQNIIRLDLRNLENAPTNQFIICEGSSNTQVSAISDNIFKRIKEELGLRPNHVEGQSDAKWILVDYFDIIVHIFYPETRVFYDIENLWIDAEKIEYADI